MPGKSNKDSVISRLRRQLNKGRLSDDVSVVYRVQGGVHGEQTEKSVVLSAAGPAWVSMSRTLGRKRAAEGGQNLGPKAALDAVRELEAAIDDLVPQSEARFVPDSLVASFTIGIGDETETYYFIADEEAYQHEGKAVPAGVRRLVDYFGDIEKTCLDPKRGDGINRPDRQVER